MHQEASIYLKTPELCWGGWTARVGNERSTCFTALDDDKAQQRSGRVPAVLFTAVCSRLQPFAVVHHREQRASIIDSTHFLTAVVPWGRGFETDTTGETHGLHSYGLNLNPAGTSRVCASFFPRCGT